MVTVEANKDAKDESLKKLEYLSLESKVCSELDTHVGTSDNVLAEFITGLGYKCVTVYQVDVELKKNGAEMPDYFVKTLLTIIHAILPPKPKEKGSNDEKDTKFTGLSMEDGRDRVRELEREIEKEAEERRRKALPQEDEEEDYSGWKRSRDKDKDRDRGRERERRERYDRDRNRVEDRDGDHRNRGRDMDRPDGGARGRYDDQEEDTRDGRKYREKRGDDYDIRGRYRYEDGDEDVEEERKGRSERYRSDEPEIYQVYKGRRVSRVMDSGCFVQLLDFKVKEGLVHVSQMASRKIANAKDVVKRYQEVYVKLISNLGGMLSVSMRDVD